MPRKRRWSFFMPALEHETIRLLDDIHRGWFTPIGRVVLWCAALSGVLLLGRLTSGLLYCYAFYVSCLLLSQLMNHLYRPSLEMERHISNYPSAGETYSYRVTVANTGQSEVRNLVVEERRLPAELRPISPPPLIKHLAPGESVTVTLKLKCHRRGAYELTHLQGASINPSGLFKAGRSLPRHDRLLVLPAVTPVDHIDLPAVRSYQPGGIPVASQVGESVEFYGTRDWRMGDRVRDIHWASTARAGRLIVREFHEEYFVRLALVMDIEAQTRQEEELLERAISITAGLTDALARNDYIVDIFAAGSEIYHLQAGRSLANLDSILEILACLEPEDRFESGNLQNTLLSQADHLSAVVLLFMKWTPERISLVNSLVSRQVSVRVFLLEQSTARNANGGITEILEFNA